VKKSATRRAVYLPKPYPDEILYSVIARYAERSGIRNLSELNVSLFDSPRIASVDVPNRLRHFAETSSVTLDLGAEECLDKLTLAPYYFAYLSEDRRKKCLRAMLDTSPSNVQNLIGITTSRVRLPTCLRFCNSCRREQRKLFGESYWVRTHQLPGVLTCSDHSLLLSDSGVSYRGASPSRYVSVEEAAAYFTSPNIGANPLFDDLARACNAALFREGPPWEDHCFLLGSLKSGLRVKDESFSLATEFRSFFGQQLLRRLGCDIDPEENYNWFASTFVLRTAGFTHCVIYWRIILLSIVTKMIGHLLPGKSGVRMRVCTREVPRNLGASNKSGKCSSRQCQRIAGTSPGQLDQIFINS
jgi:hypothetical protein